MDLWVVGLLEVAIWVAVFYYAAILVGFYKDPLMTRLRQYGDEDEYTYPLATLLGLLGLSALLLALVTGEMGAIFWVVAMLLVMGAGAIRQVAWLRGLLPRWYASLRAETSRQERHALAMAWFRLPLKSRLHLGANTYAFRVFVDEVRLTVIYGARPPDDPWLVWQ